MYNSHKVILVFVFITSLIVPIFFEDLKFAVDGISDGIITFFSIIFGFNLTAISTLYGKYYIKMLSRMVDKKKPTQTQLYTLKCYLSLSCYLALIAIAYQILFEVFELKTSKYSLLGHGMEKFYTNLTLSFFCTNIIVLVLLLRFFLKGLLEEAN